MKNLKEIQKKIIELFDIVKEEDIISIQKPDARLVVSEITELCTETDFYKSIKYQEIQREFVDIYIKTLINFEEKISRAYLHFLYKTTEAKNSKEIMFSAIYCIPILEYVFRSNEKKCQFNDKGKCIDCGKTELKHLN